MDILDDLLDAIQESINDCHVAYDLMGRDLEQSISEAHSDLLEAQRKIAQIKQKRAD
jgi:hypothetical protein